MNDDAYQEELAAKRRQAMEKFEEEFAKDAPVPVWLEQVWRRGLGNGDGGRAQAVEGAILDGRRNVTLTSMGGSMRQRGFTEAAIRAALEVENRDRCVPPLDSDQVATIARSLARYAPDPMAGATIRLDPDRSSAELVRVPASQLRRLDEAKKWLWKGCVPAGLVTILSALPKAGKTTLLAHLLRACATGETFCGLEVLPAKVVCVTEESETVWAERRDRLGLEDHCEFVLRPFRTKPGAAVWTDFLARLTDSLAKRPAELVVIDTLAKLWPVANENDASEVTAALMPLQEVAYGLNVTLLLVHHLRKSGGDEATATRGSGGITAAVDSILELRRYRPADRKDRRRVLNCDGRFDGRVDELVMELAADGKSYLAYGDRSDAAVHEHVPLIAGMLPILPPGMTQEELIEAWPTDEAPRKASVLDALRYGFESGLWSRSGRGIKGDPYRYATATGTGAGTP